MLAAASATRVSIPICAKLRLLSTLEGTIRFCRLLVPHVDVLTLHGRTRGFVEERRKGPADLQQVKQVFEELRKQSTDTDGGDTVDKMAAAAAASTRPTGVDVARCPRSLLLWTNGNVRCDGDVARNLALTKADGCMVGEAILSDPTMFDPKRGRAHPELDSFAVDGLLQVREFDRKMAIAEEYIQMLQAPHHQYYSPFDAPPAESDPGGTNSGDDLDLDVAVAISSLPSAASPPVVLCSSVSDSTFASRLVAWSSFHSHLYRLFNSDGRARFLYQTQLADDFLDATSIGEMRRVLHRARERLVDGRPFDHGLQADIDKQRSQRQAARAAKDRRRLAAAASSSGQVKSLNSRERKRARWQQRRDEKRRKGADGQKESATEEDTQPDGAAMEANTS